MVNGIRSLNLGTSLLLFIAALTVPAAGCGSDRNGLPLANTPTPTVSPTRLPTATATVTASPTAAPSATPTGTPTVSAIDISPNVALNNPAAESAAAAPAQTFTLTFTAYDSTGKPITPSSSNPLTVNIYGDFPSPNNVVTPDSTTITSANTTASFTYNGYYFPNILSVEAYIKDPAVPNGYALGSATITHANRVECAASTVSYPLDLLSSAPNTLDVQAAVGYGSSPKLARFTIDTGSLGVVVPAAELGPDAIGPGAAGLVFYSSSKFTFYGNMYLAPVSIMTESGVVQTNPIQVLAITSSRCDKPGCTPPPPNLHYLGVGFDRNDPVVGDLFHSPAENAFLNVTDASGGTDIAQGYVLTGNTTAGAALGIAAATLANFDTVDLMTSAMQWGDWLTPHGCFGFPALPGAPQFCGTVLLDVGISAMFLDLAPSLRPAEAVDNRVTPPSVPVNTKVNILAGDDPNAPAMAYSFYYNPASPSGPAPTEIEWAAGSAFVNTGRNPLQWFDYLYDSQCGKTGYRRVK